MFSALLNDRLFSGVSVFHSYCIFLLHTCAEELKMHSKFGCPMYYINCITFLPTPVLVGAGCGSVLTESERLSLKIS